MKYLSPERIKKEILHADCTPAMAALSFSVGIGLAFSPFPGIHIITAFILTRFTRLNGVLMLLGILIHNPWTMIPIHMLSIVIGDLVLSGELVSMEAFKAFPWEQLVMFNVFSMEFWREHGGVFLSLIEPFFVGHMILSVITMAISYKLTLVYIARHMDEFGQNEEEATLDSPLPEEEVSPSKANSSNHGSSPKEEAHNDPKLP